MQEREKCLFIDCEGKRAEPNREKALNDRLQWDGKREDNRGNSMTIEQKVPYGRIQIRVLGNVVAICKKLSYNEKNY